MARTASKKPAAKAAAPRKRKAPATPTRFSQAVFDRICERIAAGQSLTSICKDPDMPGKANVMQWLLKDEAGALRDQYARAREMQADAIFDESLDIADDARNDWMERQAEKGPGYELNGEHIQRSKLRIDARKWMAAKLKPKVYGERQAVDLTVTDKTRDTAELIHELTANAEALGLNPADLLQSLGPRAETKN